MSERTLRNEFFEAHTSDIVAMMKHNTFRRYLHNTHSKHDTNNTHTHTYVGQQMFVFLKRLRQDAVDEVVFGGVGHPTDKKFFDGVP